MRRPKFTLLSLGRLFVFFVLIMMFVGVVMKWRAGTAFEHYRNWRGQWVSVADAPEALVLGAVILVIFVVGIGWSWRDKRQEDRFIKEIKKRESDK